MNVLYEVREWPKYFQFLLMVTQMANFMATHSLLRHMTLDNKCAPELTHIQWSHHHVDSDMPPDVSPP